MTADCKTRPIALPEFVCLIAFMISIVALSTDFMLPAMSEMAQDLGVGHENDIQLVITTLFLGLMAGQLFAGPLSDRFGRRPVIYFGYALFTLVTVGSTLSLLTIVFPQCWLGAIFRT